MNDSIQKQHEDLLISTFIKKELRNRYMALLKNKKGRQKLRHRLAHSFDFDTKWAHKIPSNEQSIDSINKLLKSKNAPKECYVVSEHTSLDGKILPLKEALTMVVGSGIASILSCIPGQLAYLEREESSERYILEKTSYSVNQ